MLKITPLSREEIKTLDQMRKNHPSHAPRTRSHAVLLKNSGYELSNIAGFYGVCRQTVATWLHDWESKGICGLLDNPRSGRPRIYSRETTTKALELINQTPRSLKKVIAELSKTTGLTLNLSTLKRLCKESGLIWKRVRKSLKSKRNPELFELSRQQIEELKKQESRKEIDLFYFDESGFTLEPYVSYAWILKGKNIEVPCSRSKRLNVLGFVNKDCKFTSIVFEGTITSDEVIAGIDHFALSLIRPTFLVVDNASIHTSAKFKESVKRWKKLGLTVTYLSPYSPELNIIEIVWRKIKYEWMPFSAFESFSALKESLFDILANIGKSYTVEFT